MIVEGENGLIDHTKLEGIEIEIFKRFLDLERARHQQDIIKINKTVRELTNTSKPPIKD